MNLIDQSSDNHFVDEPVSSASKRTTSEGSPELTDADSKNT